MLCLSWEGGKKSDNRIVTVDKIQVGLMPERGIIDAVFICVYLGKVARRVTIE